MNSVLPYLASIGQFLIGFFFVLFGFLNLYHWRPTCALMIQKRIPLARIVLAIGIVVQVIAGSLLALNKYVGISALVLVIFTIIAVFIFHRFWHLEGEARQLNRIIFITNFTITLGALLLLLGHSKSHYLLTWLH